jgi:hypothetical protein
LLLSDGEKATLAEIAYRLGRKALREVAMVAQPETIYLTFWSRIWIQFLSRSVHIGSELAILAGGPQRLMGTYPETHISADQRRPKPLQMKGFEFGPSVACVSEQ